MLQMVQSWIAVKELNLLQRLTSSTGAGEEQALRAQEEKNTQYGKVPTARLAGEAVKQLPVGFLEGGQEKPRCGKQESSSCRCSTASTRRYNLILCVFCEVPCWNPRTQKTRL